MLQDEQATWSQYVSFANGSDNFLGDRIAIGRICENDIHRTGMVGELSESQDRIRHPDLGLSVRWAPFKR